MPQPTADVMEERRRRFAQGEQLRAASPPKGDVLTGGSGLRHPSSGRDGGKLTGGKQPRSASPVKEKKYTHAEWQAWNAGNPSHGNANQCPSGYGRPSSPDRRGQKRAASHTAGAGDSAPAVEVVLEHKVPNRDHPVINSVV